jgi:hypothetical protein
VELAGWEGLTVWRCWRCRTILGEYQVTPPSRLRVKCAKCNGWNILVAIPCPICQGGCEGAVILTNRGDHEGLASPQESEADGGRADEHGPKRR